MSLPSLTTFHIKFFSTTTLLHGKRNFRKFPLYNKRGTREWKLIRGRTAEYKLGVKPTGYHVNDEFIKVPEMIPELIVPDLTEFKLLPYVSYRAPDVIQSEFTAKDLFYACYSEKISIDFDSGKLDKEGDPLEPSENEKLTPEQAWIKARQTGCDMFCPEPPIKDKI